MNHANETGAPAKTPIMVIGDLILDIHREGERLGLSAETPTIVAKDIRRRLSRGGAGLLVRNLLELRVPVTFLTLLGEDELSREALRWSHPLLSLKSFKERRATTAKERFWVGGYKLLQWDYLDNRPIARQTEKSILSFVRKNLSGFGAIIVSDYRHGLLTESLAKALVSEAKRQKKPIFIDSQISQTAGNHLWYRGATVFCVNEKEAAAIDPSFSEGARDTALRRLAARLKTKNLIVKLGDKGSVSLLGDSIIATKAHPVSVRDTTGAGDAFLAALAASAAIPTKKSLEAANVWAGLSTTVMGPETPTLAMLERIVSEKK